MRWESVWGLLDWFVISSVDVVLVECLGSSDLVETDSEGVFVFAHHVGDVNPLFGGELLSEVVGVFVAGGSVVMLEVHFLFEVLLHYVDTSGAKALLSSLRGFQLRDFF